jgi:putative ABC transport system permease protein
VKPARLSLADVLRVGGAGLRTRPLRVTLSALGIAIGVAAMLAVVGISSSGRADLQRSLDALGTNLLTVEGAQTGQGQDVQLPDGSVAMVERIGPVQNAAAVSRLPDGINVYRNDHIPDQQTNGIIPVATDLGLPVTVGASIAKGAWLNAATATYPAVVLGADAATRLGILVPDPQVLVQIGNQQFTVVGILRPDPLVPELNSAALIGRSAAARYFASPGHPTTIYLRADDDQVEAVRQVLAATANPAAPYLVAISRPSDALAAKIATERAFNGLLLGLGAVALLVGGVGVANTMVISVLERRSEIGLRRCLGAHRGQIRLQFLVESLLLASIGGVGGIALGVAVTGGYAATQGWVTVVPAQASVAALVATLLIGAVAGIYPAMRAARLSPTEALA